MSFAIIVIAFLIFLFLFFVVLIIGLTADREQSETRRFSFFSSLTSKLPPTRTILKVTFWVVVILVIIILLISLWPKSDSRQEVSGSIEIDEHGAKWICGTVEFKNINMTTENPSYKFYVLGLKRGESVKMILTLEDELQKCEIPFIVRYSNEISGTEVSFGTKNLVYVIVNGVNLRTEAEGDDKIPRTYFITNGQKYNATFRIETDRSCVCCQKIGPGNFERTELIGQNRIGLVKFKFQ